MNFVTYSQMVRDAQAFASSFRGKVDVIVGVPRSGMLVANVMALHLNVPLTSVDNPDCIWYGSRAKAVTDDPLRLIVDDSVLSGKSMDEAVSKFQRSVTVGSAKVVALYGVQGQGGVTFHRIVNPPRLFAWNYAHANMTKHVMLDFDGIFCFDPTVPEDNELAYVKAIEQARPLMIPTVRFRAIVTHRLDRRRAITESWLVKQGYPFRPKLIMRPEKDCYERRRKGDQDGTWKGRIYKDDPEAHLFVESDPRQSQRIAFVSGKPVYCPAVDTLY